MTRARQGVVLLEVIVAMTIFTIAALSAVTWVRQVSMSLDHDRRVTEDIVSASRYLDIIALWTRDDLDRHLGARHQGVWTVRIDRVTATVYDVSIRDSTDSQILLTTSLYRPEPVRAN